MTTEINTAASWQNLFMSHLSRLTTKPTKWHVHPAKTWTRVFAVRMKKAWVLSYLLSTQRRLWSDSGWSESLLGVQVVVLQLFFPMTLLSLYLSKQDIFAKGGNISILSIFKVVFKRLLIVIENGKILTFIIGMLWLINWWRNSIQLHNNEYIVPLNKRTCIHRQNSVKSK